MSREAFLVADEIESKSGDSAAFEPRGWFTQALSAASQCRPSAQIESALTRTRAPALTLAFGLFASLFALTVVREPSVPHALLMIGIASASVMQAWHLSKRTARLEFIAKELGERESRYRMLADSSTDIIMLKRPSGERSYVSPACRVVLGYDPEEFLAIPSATFVHPEDYPRVARLNQTISPEHPQFTSVHRLRHKAGHYVWVEAAFRLTETSVGEPVVLGAIRDVTERHRQDEELKAAKPLQIRRMRRKLNFSPP